MGMSDKTEIKSQNVNVEITDNVKAKIEMIEKLLTNPQLKELDVKPNSNGHEPSGTEPNSGLLTNQTLPKKPV
jgi:hypothetical protein